MFDVKKIEFQWNEEKESIVQKERHMSFATIVAHIRAGDLLQIIPHHNQEKYPDQKILAVLIDGYVWAVPCVGDYKTFFLKTAYKDRNLTAFYFSTL